MQKAVPFSELPFDVQQRVRRLDKQMRTLQARVKTSRQHTTLVLQDLITQHNRELKATQIALNDIKRDLYHLMTDDYSRVIHPAEMD